MIDREGVEAGLTGVGPNRELFLLASKELKLAGNSSWAYFWLAGKELNLGR
jgi:hypothetical protein